MLIFPENNCNGQMPDVTHVDCYTVAAAIGRHPFTVLSWARAKIIPSIKRGKRVILFNLEEVKEAMTHNNLKCGKVVFSKEKYGRKIKK